MYITANTLPSPLWHVTSIVGQSLYCQACEPSHVDSFSAKEGCQFTIGCAAPTRAPLAPLLLAEEKQLFHKFITGYRDDLEQNQKYEDL